jgi:hypothetical protein
VPSPLSEQIRASLVAGRDEADRVLVEAERKAAELSELAGEADRALIGARLERLAQLRAQIDGQRAQIESAYAAMAEAMAVASMRLAEIARNADFSIPPWPSGIRRTVEIRLAETREVTFRIETSGGDQTDARSRPL